MFELLARFDKDTDPRKVNLAPGAYRDDNGLIWLLPSVKAATAAIISLPTYEHQYLGIQGHVPFLRQAARLILGDVAVEAGHIASLQTSGGTGACHTGAVFLKKFHDVAGDVDVFISDPSWENHHAVFQHAGLVTKSYRCYNAQTRSLDFAGMKADVEAARRGSIFVLHVCAHNPTGCDPTDEQWDELSRIFKRKGLHAFLDCAYQGFATGDLVRDK
jgi:aspartate aminotransferase